MSGSDDESMHGGPNSTADRDPLERLAEEFLERLRAGEDPSIVEYVERHPDLAESIRELLPAMVKIEQLGATRPAEEGVSAGRASASIDRALPRAVAALCIALAALALVPGCVSALPRPTTWASARPGPFLARPMEVATFRNQGASAAEHAPGIDWLAITLFDDLEGPEYLSVSHVTFEVLPDAGVSLRGWVGAELLTERTLDEPAWEDERQTLLLTDTRFSGVLLGPEWVSTRLQRTVDGALVVERRRKAVGIAAEAAPPIVLVLPMWSERQRWSRFEPWTDAEEVRSQGGSPPRGVAPPPAHPLRLEAPDGSVESMWDTLQERLLEAREIGTRALSQDERAAIGGRPTQRFLMRRNSDWYSSAHDDSALWEHDYRVEKAHDLPDIVADRYVALLVLHGFRWVDPEE